MVGLDIDKIVLYALIFIFVYFYRRDMRDYLELRSTVIKDLMDITRSINQNLISNAATLTRVYERVDRLDLLRVVDDLSYKAASADEREKTEEIVLEEDKNV